MLTEFGLVEGTRNDHPGQGTANRRYPLANTFLELLYIRDAEEAMNGPAGGLRCVERLAADNGSPFGIVVRSTDDSNDEPFPGWRYHPQYFNADQYFQVGENSEALEEPLCICMPVMPPSAEKQPQPLEPFVEVTELRIGVPLDRPSAVLESVGACERIMLALGKPHHMEIVFGHGRAGKSKNFSPQLPLSIFW